MQCSFQNKGVKPNSFQTWQTICIQRTIVPRSPNIAIETLKKMRSVFIVELHANCLQHSNFERCTAMILWRINFASDNKTYLGLHIKRPIISSDYNQIWCFTTDFHKSPPPQYQISLKSVQWEPRWYMRTDGRTDGHDEANMRFSRLCEGV